VNDDLYARLAQALDRLPNGFPRTASGVEVELLARTIPRELAEVAVELGREGELVRPIAERAGLSEEETRRRLRELEEIEGVIVETAHGAGETGADEGAHVYSLNPFFPGLFEGLAPRMDAEVAALFERYMAEGGAQGIMGAEPPIGRVLPSGGALEGDFILPFDDVREVIEKTGGVTVNDCVCRLERESAGSPCEFPAHVCLILHDTPPEPAENVVSREEALEILSETEELGLVHVVSNVGSGWEFICNCCGCCCQFLRSLNDWDVERPVVFNYIANVDEDDCTGCGTCEERCQVAAIAVEGDIAVVDEERCIGCGLCVTTCPSEAIELCRLPEAAIVAPPEDPAAWGDERLSRRRDA